MPAVETPAGLLNVNEADDALGRVVEVYVFWREVGGSVSWSSDPIQTVTMSRRLVVASSRPLGEPASFMPSQVFALVARSRNRGRAFFWATVGIADANPATIYPESRYRVTSFLESSEGNVEIQSSGVASFLENEGGEPVLLLRSEDLPGGIVDSTHRVAFSRIRRVDQLGTPQPESTTDSPEPDPTPEPLPDGLEYVETPVGEIIVRSSPTVRIGLPETRYFIAWRNERGVFYAIGHPWWAPGYGNRLGFTAQEGTTLYRSGLGSLQLHVTDIFLIAAVDREISPNGVTWLTDVMFAGGRGTSANVNHSEFMAGRGVPEIHFWISEEDRGHIAARLMLRREGRIVLSVPLDRVQHVHAEAQGQGSPQPSDTTDQSSTLCTVRFTIRDVSDATSSGRRNKTWDLLIRCSSALDPTDDLPRIVDVHAALMALADRYAVRPVVPSTGEPAWITLGDLAADPALVGAVPNDAGVPDAYRFGVDLSWNQPRRHGVSSEFGLRVIIMTTAYQHELHLALETRWGIRSWSPDDQRQLVRPSTQRTAARPLHRARRHLALD